MMEKLAYGLTGLDLLLFVAIMVVWAYKTRYDRKMVFLQAYMTEAEDQIHEDEARAERVARLESLNFKLVIFLCISALATTISWFSIALSR
ncbi:MAG: hypothetical protein HY652_04430 [Acidobacteria bacterium]|nr:hypothetical protein [Acidobacteriota bacterium]